MAKNKPQVSDKSYKPNPKFNLEVLKEFPDLVKWLKELSRYRKLEDYIYISDYKEGEIRLKIFTKDHYYSIFVKLPQKTKEEIEAIEKVKKQLEESGAKVSITLESGGYLGCIGQVRKPRAGEDWNRGNDVADGSYSAETWQKIKDHILAYELVKVVRNSSNKDEK